MRPSAWKGRFPNFASSILNAGHSQTVYEVG